MMQEESKPVLLILAAGMGSRYGGLKQLDEFGPGGETILDYSLYDALRAGFGKVVFVVREFFKDDFIRVFGDRIKGMEVDFVTQELNMVPPGFKVHPERQKPWGTAHAVLVARNAIDVPFAVINADDFYGFHAFETMHRFLTTEAKPDQYCTVGYYLKNTISDHGTVNRGVCEVENGFLKDVVECIKISRSPDGNYSYKDSIRKMKLRDQTIVSMNMWGFHPSFFTYAWTYFEHFLSEVGHQQKSEFFIPLAISEMIANRQVNVSVLETSSTWFGVTYREDKPFVEESIGQLIRDGEYPLQLWK